MQNIPQNQPNLNWPRIMAAICSALVALSYCGFGIYTVISEQQSCSGWICGLGSALLSLPWSFLFINSTPFSQQANPEIVSILINTVIIFFIVYYLIKLFRFIFNKWPRYKTIIILTLLAIIAGVVAWVYFINQQQALKAGQTSVVQANPAPAAIDVKFVGTFQAIDNKAGKDGPLSIEVSNKWIVVSGILSPPNTNPRNGSVMGLNLNTPESDIGKMVEVFASQYDYLDPNVLTILGNSKYYVKLVK